MNRYLVSVAKAAFVLILFAAGAARADELGPAVGETIPHDLSSMDSSGAEQSFETLVGENGMALFFVRSVDWCPYCQAQTIDISKAVDTFAERGLSVVFVSYDSTEEQAKFAEKRDIKQVMLSDPESEIIDAFGLRNESHTSGRYAGIPHPAVFIVSSQREILAKLYEEDYLSNDKSYRNRPAVDRILEEADTALGGNGAD